MEFHNYLTFIIIISESGQFDHLEPKTSHKPVTTHRQACKLKMLQMYTIINFAYSYSSPKSSFSSYCSC